MQDQLKALIEKTRDHKMTPAEIEEQRISFAFGNTNLEDPGITREHVIQSSESLRQERQSRKVER